MGGYRGGSDPELDKAIEIVPKIFEAMKQRPQDAASTDAFQEVARALSA
jgi:flagellum-specific ATP synthase